MPKVPQFILRNALSGSRFDDLLWVREAPFICMRRFLQKTLGVALMGVMLATPLMLSAQGGKKGGKGGGGRGGGRKKSGSRKKGGN
jgi:hypothetical protein